MRAYRFGDLELDLDAHQLRKDGQPLRLERRPMDLLVLLVQRQGRLVSREEIIAELWPGNVIIDFESGVNTLIRKVRTALGDTAEQPRFIETVSGRGYRFIAAVESLDRPPVAAALAPRSRRAMAALLAASLIAIVAVAWQLIPRDASQTRIAILPLENLTGDDRLEYLAMGIAEETNISLARIGLPNLAVIGMVSANKLSSAGLPLKDAEGELGADYIVASSLRQEGSRIRVASRLIRVADGEQIWSATFDRELTNLLGLQRELSVAIAEQVRQRLSPSVAAAIDRRQTRNAEAYELYLRGRYEWMQFRPDSIPRALQFYRQAVDRDPGYALAWAGIAHALATSTVTVAANRQAVYAQSADALRRAVETGADLAETQLALGAFRFFLHGDLSGAETASRLAVELDPNSAMSHMFLGVVLSERGRHVEARAMLRRARELEPLFPLMFANSAMVSLRADESQESLELATQAVAIDPEFWVGYLHLGNARLALDDYEAARRAYADAERLSGGNGPGATASRAFVLAVTGREAEARDLLAELVQRSERRNIPAYEFAVVHAGLGEVDAAFEWLERGIAAGDVFCFDLESDQKLGLLRSDLRFEPLVARCRFAGELEYGK